MRAIITVTGIDGVGIVAAVSNVCAKYGVNINDISQSVIGEYFAMIMIVDISSITQELSSLAEECNELGKQIGMSVYLQHEDIFNAMHNV